MTEVISKNMYNWEINIDFYPTSHQYKLVKEIEKDWKMKKEKETLISVSSISWILDKPWLIVWAVNLSRDHLLSISEQREITKDDIFEAAKQHTIRRDKAGEIGTIAHKRCEDYITKWEMSLPEDNNVANAINWFLEWKKQHNIEFLKSEVLVYSKKYNYVGILDSIANIDWKKYLIDFKTSNWIDILGYWMQTCGYKIAYEEETWEKIDWIIIVRFSKETHDKYGNELKPFEVQEIVDIEYLQDCFLSALKLKNAVKKYDKF